MAVTRYHNSVGTLLYVTQEESIFFRNYVCIKSFEGNKKLKIMHAVIDYYSMNGFLHLLAREHEECCESLGRNYAK